MSIDHSTAIITCNIKDLFTIHEPAQRLYSEMQTIHTHLLQADLKYTGTYTHESLKEVRSYATHQCFFVLFFC